MTTEEAFAHIKKAKKFKRKKHLEKSYLKSIKQYNKLFIYIFIIIIYLIKLFINFNLHFPHYFVLVVLFANIQDVQNMAQK